MYPHLTDQDDGSHTARQFTEIDKIQSTVVRDPEQRRRLRLVSRLANKCRRDERRQEMLEATFPDAFQQPRA